MKFGEDRKMKVGILPANIALAINVILGMIPMYIHIWTTVVAVLYGNALLAAVSFFLPLISWFYWFAAVWKLKGTIANPYCLFILTSVIFFILSALRTLIPEYFSNQEVLGANTDKNAMSVEE
jgi:hypothetical protein